MPDTFSQEKRSEIMRKVKGKDTGLERRLFAMLAGMRLNGWKKNVEDLVGRPDAAFIGKRVVIFVDGCFWHGCPHCARPLPETNREYWERKINRNIERDERSRLALINDGWHVIRIWGHEMRDPSARAKIRSQIRKALAKSETPVPKRPW